MMLYPTHDQATAPSRTNTELEKRVADLEAALKPFAGAYEALLDNEPSPDVVINTVQRDRYVMYGHKHHLVQWSDLYRAANLLRETPHV